jgi:hypothetical protein
MQYRLQIIGLILVSLLNTESAAQRAYTLTEARSATGKTVSSAIHLVDLSGDPVSVSVWHFPGAQAYAALGPPDRHDAFVATALNPITGLRTFKYPLGKFWTRPEGRRTMAFEASLAPSGWTYGDLVYVPGKEGAAGRIALLAIKANRGQMGEGRLEIRPLGAPDRSAENAPPAFVPLPGEPLALSVIPNTQTVAVLCRSEQDNLCIVDLVDQRIVLSTHATAPAELVAQQPSGLSVDPLGQHIFVLISGFASQGSSGGGASALRVYDAATLESAAPPLDIQGRAIDPSTSTQAAMGGLCWVVTRDTVSNFASVTAARIVEGELKTVVESSFTSIRHAALLAPSPTGNGVAIGLDNRLEVWPENRPGGAVAKFDAAVGSIAWNADTLLVGEGGRVHRVNPRTARSEQHLQLQTGIVAALLSVSTSSRIYQEAAAPSPILQEIPSSIWLRSEAAGQELKGFRIDPSGNEELEWELDYDQEASPWLHVHPLSGTTPAEVRMALSPYAPSITSTQTSSLTLRIKNPGDPTPRVLDDTEISVNVAPNPNKLRRVLWIWPADNQPTPLRSQSDPYHLKHLADLLAAPPHLFAHTETWDPIAETPESYTVVVMDIRAAAQGTLTRSSLLDYVARGGSLLLLGDHLTEDEASVLARWLSPIGVRVKGGIRVEGRFAATSEHELALRWSNFQLRNGCMIQLDRADAVLAKGTEPDLSAVFAQVPYGLGRVAILAAPTPLESDALAAAENHRFASALFEWLARGRYEIGDVDSDGLADSTEDRNGNGVVDLGETDMFDDDTDGDGLPDGAEDANRNGWFDRGETSPLNADTDGDGINDGADASPLPEGGAPFVSAVEMTEPGPLEGPAEGGDFVTIRGGNFTPDTAVWFGEQVAPRVRMLDDETLNTTTPPYRDPAGGTVRVRVVNQAGQQEGTLPLGYRYTAISQVKMEFKRLATAGDMYSGSFSLKLNAPGVSLGDISFQVETKPEGIVKILGIESGQGAIDHERSLSIVSRSPYRASLTFSAGNRGDDLGEVLRLRWGLTRHDKLPAVSIYITDPVVRARNGVTLPVSIRPKIIQFARPNPARPSRAN